MKRNLTLMIVVVAILALSFASSSALACGKAKSCEVSSCETEKTADGFRCTMKAEGDDEVAALREMIRSCAEHKEKEGVYVSLEEVEGGITMTASATDPEIIEALHSKADACASGKCGSGCGSGCGGGCGGDCGKSCGDDCGKDHECCKGKKATDSPCGKKADAA
jgi:hypothetical protein